MYRELASFVLKYGQCRLAPDQFNQSVTGHSVWQHKNATRRNFTQAYTSLCCY